MNREEVKKRVIELVMDKAIHEDEPITEESNLKDLGLDSLDCIELSIQLESEFEVVIPEEESEKMKTVADAINIVMNHK
jgi:acyl carrier protein